MFTVTPSPLYKIRNSETQERLAFIDYIRKNYSVVINVADTECAIPYFQNAGIPSYWFPICEYGYWGYSPFFGALRATQDHYDGIRNVLIHCHAGAHRSPVVAFVLLRAYGKTAEEAETLLEYPNLNDIFLRDVKKGRIPEDIVEFLQTSMKDTSLSLKDTGQYMGKTSDFYGDVDDCKYIKSGSFWIQNR